MLILKTGDLVEIPIDELLAEIETLVRVEECLSHFKRPATVPAEVKQVTTLMNKAGRKRNNNNQPNNQPAKAPPAGNSKTVDKTQISLLASF